MVEALEFSESSSDVGALAAEVLGGRPEEDRGGS